MKKSEWLELLDKVEQALEKAKKQEKLLMYYESLIIVKNDMLSCCEVVDDDYHYMKEVETYYKNKIKELEK